MTTAKLDVLEGFAGSAAHQQRAQKRLALGVSSSPRATQQPVPLAIQRGQDAHIWDVDDNEYVDYALGYGPLLLGHSPQPVIRAVHDELARGLRVGSVHEGEAELAERLAAIVPSAELSTFVSSGTEAVALALRIARAQTGRDRVVKFRWHYHGWSDGIHVGMNGASDGPGTAGQDPAAARNVVLVDWGDAAALEEVLDDTVAAIVMEAAPVNAGCFAPPVDFLERVRALTRERGVLLIFDEVITGFRLALGGAQEKYGVEPDLTVLGKVLGAGLPISAVAGTTAAMAPLTERTVLHRGTYNGNPVSVAAANAALNYLSENAATIYPRMHVQARQLATHLREEGQSTGLSLTVNEIGSCLQVFVGQVPDLLHLNQVDREATVRLTGAMVRHGIAPLPRGLMYLSTVHSDQDIEHTLAAISRAINDLAQETNS